LDDDNIVRMVWRMDAKKKGHELRDFAVEEEFMAELMGIPENRRHEVLVYVDQSLGTASTRTGEEILKELYTKGFRKLHLCTGYEHIKDTLEFKVQGKDYPEA